MGRLCDKHVISLFTGTLPQSEAHHWPPAQPCWPVCRGPRTHQANTWPARARPWSCASVSGSPHPAQYPLCCPSPLRLSPSFWCVPGHTKLVLSQAFAGQYLGRERTSSTPQPCLDLSAFLLAFAHAVLPPGSPFPTMAPTPLVWPAPTGCDLLPSSLR